MVQTEKIKLVQGISTATTSMVDESEKLRKASQELCKAIRIVNMRRNRILRFQDAINTALSVGHLIIASRLAEARENHLAVLVVLEGAVQDALSAVREYSNKVDESLDDFGRLLEEHGVNKRV